MTKRIITGLLVIGILAWLSVHPKHPIGMNLMGGNQVIPAVIVTDEYSQNGVPVCPPYCNKDRFVRAKHVTQ